MGYCIHALATRIQKADRVAPVKTSHVESRCAFFAYPVPTEKHDGDKGGFQKKSNDAFNGKGCTKDVAHKPAVIRPVCAELKLQNNSRGNTNGEVNTENLLPERVVCFHFSSPVFT